MLHLIKTKIRKGLSAFGLDVIRTESLSQRNVRYRREKLFAKHKVSTVIDVGANLGQFARDQRRGGFEGEIVSFEPGSKAFNELKILVESDPLWTAHQIAIGASDGIMNLNIAGNLQSSSLLKMLPRHSAALPSSVYETTEQIQVRSLDSLLLDGLIKPNKTFLKIDVQGYENRVIEGAKQFLSSYVAGVQFECSLTGLYEGEASMQELFETVQSYGFGAVAIDPAFCDEVTGELLQLDCVFFRLA